MKREHNVGLGQFGGHMWSGGGGALAGMPNLVGSSLPTCNYITMHTSKMFGYQKLFSNPK